jgi:hypothetical protein
MSELSDVLVSYLGFYFFFKIFFQILIILEIGGDGDLAHDLVWHELRADRPTICAHCGQVFKLKTTAAPDHHHEPIPEGAIVEDVGNITAEPVTEELKAFWKEFQDAKAKFANAKE